VPAPPSNLFPHPTTAIPTPQPTQSLIEILGPTIETILHDNLRPSDPNPWIAQSRLLVLTKLPLVAVDGTEKKKSQYPCHAGTRMQTMARVLKRRLRAVSVNKLNTLALPPRCASKYLKEKL
jgi:hypothetical protein